MHINKFTNDSRITSFCRLGRRPWAILISLFIILYVESGYSHTIAERHIESQSALQNNLSFITSVKGQGQAILLIPGLMSNGSVFETLANRLSADYQVHTLSLKGFAGTEQNGKFSLNQLITDIAEYIKTQKLGPVFAVGHSMGGLSAFKLVSEQEPLVKKMISIDGLPFIGPIFTRSNATTVDMLKPQAVNIRNMFYAMTPEQLAAQAQQGIFIQATAAQDQARIIDMARSSDPKTAGDAMYEVMQTDLRQQLASVNTPMLLLGASGAFTQATQHEQVAELYQAQLSEVKSAKVVMNTQSRHFIMFDDIDWLEQQVRDFFGANRFSGTEN